MIKKGLVVLIFLLGYFTSVVPAFAISNNEIQQIFSTGRSLGAAYYYLLDLTNKSPDTDYQKLKGEYQSAFQSLNIAELISGDLSINDDSTKLLNDVRFCLYNSLKKQDLSPEKLANTVNEFANYYDALHKFIASKYADQGAQAVWYLDLGFYSSFQYESVNSKDEAKLLISGFDKLSSNIPFGLPTKIVNDIKSVKLLDKPDLTTTELDQLRQNVMELMEYFSNYPNVKPLFAESRDLVGTWQGILIDPNCNRSDIRLTINDDMSAKMDINGIARSINISEIDVVDSYFTFLFKPFGTEKLYIKFNAKLTNNVFSGEVTDVLNDKGYWVLAKLNQDKTLSDSSLDAMASYIKTMETKLKEVPASNQSDLILKDKIIQK